MTEQELSEIRTFLRSWQGERDDDGYLVEGPEWDTDDIAAALRRLLTSHDRLSTLPPGWRMVMPGYAVDYGQSKAERGRDHVARYCDARGGRVITWAQDGQGVPVDVVRACIESAADFPAEFKQ